MDTKVDRVLAQRSRAGDLRSIWLRPLGLAVLLHSLLAGATLIAASWPTKPPAPIEYVAVQILPAPARGVRRPPAPRPPAPAPEEKTVEDKPEPKPEPKPPDPPQGSPEGTASGTSRLGYQVLGFEGSTFPFAYYLDQVLKQVDDNWSRPPVAGLKAVVFFRILRDGRVVDLELKEGSGNRAFDLSALRAVTHSSPLPPLPVGYREPTLSVHLIVR